MKIKSDYRYWIAVDSSKQGDVIEIEMSHKDALFLISLLSKLSFDGWDGTHIKLQLYVTNTEVDLEYHPVFKASE